MLTNQIRKQRRERTMIGLFQSKWQRALKKLDKVPWKSMVIALSTIMILGTFLLFINTQNPQMPKERNLKMWNGAITTPPALPVAQPMNPMLQQMGQTPPMLPSMTLQQQMMQAQLMQPPPQLPVVQHGHAPQMPQPVAQLPTAQLPPSASQTMQQPMMFQQAVQQMAQQQMAQQQQMMALHATQPLPQSSIAPPQIGTASAQQMQKQRMQPASRPQPRQRLHTAEERPPLLHNNALFQAVFSFHESAQPKIITVRYEKDADCQVDQKFEDIFQSHDFIIGRPENKWKAVTPRQYIQRKLELNLRKDRSTAGEKYLCEVSQPMGSTTDDRHLYLVIFYKVPEDKDTDPQLVESRVDTKDIKIGTKLFRSGEAKGYKIVGPSRDGHWWYLENGDRLRKDSLIPDKWWYQNE